MREERRLRVFENAVLRKLFGPKRDEKTGSFIIFAPYTILFGESRGMRWSGHVAYLGDTRCAYRVLVGKSEGRSPLGKPGRRWEDNIKMYLQKWDGGAWNELACLRI
jgi:hypothetical protein